VYFFAVNFEQLIWYS